MSIPARLSIVTLGVADLPASVEFYEALGWRTSPESNDDIAWFPLGSAALGLDLRGLLADDASVADSPPAFDGVTLAINFASVSEVDAAFRTAIAAGASVAKPAEPTDWGGYSGYFADPDGHLWELAYNPAMLP